MPDHSYPVDPEMLGLMKEERRWFGFAPRTYQGEVIDGKRRIAAAEQLGFAVPAAVECRSIIEAARWLATMRHLDRCLAFQRAHLGMTIPLRVTNEIAAELAELEHHKDRQIARRRILARTLKRWDERHEAIGRMNTLLREVEQRAYGASAEELRLALGPQFARGTDDAKKGPARTRPKNQGGVHLVAKTHRRPDR